jgi:multimeric flavodoxin WrbA
MKQVLVLCGSPHKQGATAALLDAALDGIGDAAVTRFDAFALNPAPCDDCRRCHVADGCRHRDLDAFYAALEAADVLVFATPVYNRSFPAPMKAVLDRLQRYWSARFIRGIKPPITTPKTALLLTSGGADRGDGVYLEEQLAPILTILHSTPAVAVHADNTDRRAIDPAVLATAKTAGKTIST